MFFHFFVLHAHSSLSQLFLSIVPCDAINLKAKNGDLISGAELHTDGAIRRQRKDLSHLDGRDLQSASAWLGLDASTDTSLGDENIITRTSSTGNGGNSTGNISSSSIGKWDQFETNSRLFNVKNTYNEDLYTKKLDLSKMSREQRSKAERLAREIETSTTGNIHLQEVNNR